MTEKWKRILDAEADPDHWWVCVIAKALDHGERIALLDWLRAEQGRQITPVTARSLVPGVGKRMTNYQLTALADVGLIHRVGRFHIEGSRGQRQEVYEFGKGPNAELVADVFDVCAGRRRVANLSVGDGTVPRVSLLQLEAIAKALGHPIRLRIIRDLERDGEASPARWAEANGMATPKADYHFLTLGKLGAAKVGRKTPVRAVTTHHYSLTGELSAATVAVLDVLQERARLVKGTSSRKKRASRRKGAQGVSAAA